MRDTVTDKVSKPVPREWRGDYSEETKQSAVLELCSNELTPNELCQKYGISRGAERVQKKSNTKDNFLQPVRNYLFANLKK